MIRANFRVSDDAEMTETTATSPADGTGTDTAHPGSVSKPPCQELNGKRRPGEGKKSIPPTVPKNAIVRQGRGLTGG